MKPVVVSDILAVGEFPTAEQIAILAKAGFKSVLNNQPDGEVERFASAAVVEGEARRHGLGYAYAPLGSRTPSESELERYAEAVRSLPAPIYAFCYSGARSAAACAMLMTERLEVDQLIKEFGEAGFDIEALRPWLDEARARHEASNGSGPAKAAATSAVAVPPAAAAPVKPANGNGQHAASGAGDNGAVRKPDDASTVGLPRMVVVQPRAAGFGGFAM
jgi:sulfide:quinone oxidoreductase